jgi:hypothetical protein
LLRQGGQTVSNGVFGQLCYSEQLQLLHNDQPRIFNGLSTDTKDEGDFFNVLSIGYVLKYFQLSRGKVLINESRFFWNTLEKIFHQQ